LSVAQHHRWRGKAELGLDCEAAIKALSAEKDLKVSAVDYDLVMEGRQLAAALPTEVKWKWIKGHQDKIAGQHLDWWALQNIRMDRKAKRHGKKNKGNALGPLRLSTERWAFTVKGEKHACMNKKAVYEILREDKIKTYRQKKDGITNDAWGDINWKASKVALKEQPRGMKIFGAKFATRHIATRRMMKLRQEWTHSTCPQMWGTRRDHGACVSMPLQNRHKKCGN
jgi:hypothetical protein